jgi:hypothetical protein
MSQKTFYKMLHDTFAIRAVHAPKQIECKMVLVLERLRFELEDPVSATIEFIVGALPSIF